jgi:hypothetical protein
MTIRELPTVQRPEGASVLVYAYDVHESVRRDIIMNTTNEMQLYRLIYYS